MEQTPCIAAKPSVDPLVIAQAVERACGRIAPTWPLDRFIAVNPFWGNIEMPVPEVSSRLAALSGSCLLMPRAWYHEQWKAGLWNADHLAEAIAQTNSKRTVEQLLAKLETERPEPERRGRVSDVVDAQRDLSHAMSFRDFITHSLSQHCAAYFDEGQAQVQPVREGGLYATWLRHALLDRSPGLLLGFRDYRQTVQKIPHNALELLTQALVELDVAPSDYETYLTMLLLDINGWAAFCAYRRWMARLEGKNDDHIIDLLAVRMAWELLLYRAGGRTLARRWQMEMAHWRDIEAKASAGQADDWVVHKALEIAYQEKICRAIPMGLDNRPPTGPAVQAVFCIDVRSEVFRRALEAQSESIQTLGFAGFFGAPIEYQPTASTTSRPQLPGLLAPRFRATDTGVSDEVVERRRFRLEADSIWKTFKRSAISGFSFVETTGLFYAGKLLGHSLGISRPVEPPESAGLSRDEHRQRKPRLTDVAGGGLLDTEARCDLAAGILRAMSLTHDFARLVVLVGHGSETVNNPHAAGLDCGACCGQTGEVNARAVAALLNDKDVRSGLSARGIDVPSTSIFVAGLHNTTTDMVELFDLDEVPATHAPDLIALRQWLDGAGARARTERATNLGLDGMPDEALRKAVVSRARDWSQVRPEWGLANNAAFIVAPREFCRHLDLAGRSFLHEYRWQEDRDFAILELIMTAPMVVTHWINFQYYASTVDNLRYGSGNKVLHNVVGEHLGVFEGNGGDLRIGLSLQSLHDGQRFMHTPLRLSVFIEAPQEAIDAVLKKHLHVRQLVDNEWIHLFQIDAERKRVYAYRHGHWEASAREPAFLRPS